MFIISTFCYAHFKNKDLIIVFFYFFYYQQLTESAYVGLCLCIWASENQPSSSSYDTHGVVYEWLEVQLRAKLASWLLSPIVHQSAL